MVSLALLPYVSACKSTNGTSAFINRLLPVPQNGGFQDPDFGIWGSSVIKGEDYFDGMCTHNPQVIKYRDQYLLYHFERPFLLIENGKPTHLFAATGTGPKAWQFDRAWNMVIPFRTDV